MCILSSILRKLLSIQGYFLKNCVSTYNWFSRRKFSSFFLSSNSLSNSKSASSQQHIKLSDHVSICICMYVPDSLLIQNALT